MPKSQDRRETFFLNLTGRIPWRELPNRGMFAVLDEISRWGCGRRLCIAHSPAELRRCLTRLRKKGMLPNPSGVCVETAASESDLTDLEYERLIQDVLIGIDAIKGRGDKTTLRRLRSAIESSGRKPGPVPTYKTRRRLVQLLQDLAKERGVFKALVPHERSARAQLHRFCTRFHDDCFWLGISSVDDLKRACGSHYVKRKLRELHCLDLPANLAAAKAAYLLGEKYRRKPSKERPPRKRSAQA